MEKINYVYKAVRYDSKYYEPYTIEEGNIKIPDFKTFNEIKEYLDDMCNRGCSLPYTSKKIGMYEKENGFDVHTCNSIVVEYRKATTDNSGNHTNVF